MYNYDSYILVRYIAGIWGRFQARQQQQGQLPLGTRKYERGGMRTAFRKQVPYRASVLNLALHPL
jgi:hypothetical protein